MKYGVLYNQNNINIGDDIQAYATMQYLPHVDYFIDREHIDEFRSDDEEPVAVIMNAWYMWRKWNWPPSKYIVPKMIGFHYADHQLARQPGTPFKYEFLTGIGGEYLKAYGPIGTRDFFPKEQLEALDIPAYLSGCITMTIPNMPDTEDKGTYICLVDLEERVTTKIQRLLENEDIEVRVMTHTRARDEEMTWEEREKIVKERLLIYQNARCVVTKKLHCSLPCLALGTPVFLIKEMEDDIRFSPYYDFLHRTTVTNFMNDNYEYDFMNPLPNKEDFKALAQSLSEQCKKFIEEMEQASEKTVEDFCKTTYTQEDVLKWRHDLMKVSMDKWYEKHRAVQLERTSLRRENRKLKSAKENLEREIAQLNNKKQNLEKENESLKMAKKHLESRLSERAIRKIKKIIKG